MAIDDKRAAKRISYLCEVECEGAGLSRLATRINDLSLTGAFIDSMTCFAPRTTLRLRFHIKDVLIETTADVRYTMPRMGMGVQFRDLTEEQQAAIESLIEGKPIPTRLPSTPEKSSSSSVDVLSGNFAVVSLCDVIQIIENNKLSGVLSLTSPSTGGEVQFNDGIIVGASCGSVSGLEALKCCLDITEGTFEFMRSLEHFSPAFQSADNKSLMIDLLRTKEDAPSLT
jgi:hypothetical protein